MGNGRTVLVVESRDDARGEIGDWLDDEGFDVMACPGPHSPDFTCVGGRGEPCPLADAADIIVLDLYLESDQNLRGVPGWELLLYYAGRGRPLVVLSGPEDTVRPLPDANLTIVRRPPARDEVVAAVRRLAGYGANP